MTYLEACGIVDRVTYPNMLFILEQHSDELRYDRVMTLQVNYKCVDSETGKQTFLNIREKIALMDWMSEHDLVNWIWYVVKKVSVHEAGEFFKVDGKAPFHPHKALT